MKKTAIIIVVYNTADFLVKQIECIRKFCADKPDIIIVDNSDFPDVTAALLYRLENKDCIYLKTNSASGNPSLSHAFAANLAYHKYYSDYDHLLFLDHDAFLIKELSIKEVLGTKVAVGMGQGRPSGKKYFWPGCLFLNSTLLGDNVDFSPNGQYGLDTGGNLYKLIEQYAPENIGFLNEHYGENMHYTKLHHNVYSIIGDGMVMHFIAGSNWQKASEEDHNARISGLMVILNEKIGGISA